jgi:hypothetical protein
MAGSRVGKLFHRRGSPLPQFAYKATDLPRVVVPLPMLDRPQSPVGAKMLPEARAYLGEAARRAIRKPGTVTLARGLK